ncbi:hypothetical protein [Paenibacillus sp. tmac-D7]|uniref:hypothetical protein n=1 Tax=Paenibacillus sp. tmac-D7 TaxID=2591462 RepID=UPI0011424457|nr:hypothetical protein [Paenibacillus sp. tmac-D7]
MLQAQLYGKTSSELTWSEDILTSNIFGMLKYLSSPAVIVNVLRNAISLDNRALFIPNDIQGTSYHFWPKLRNSEPDLVLVLHSSQGDHLVGMEAKYLSKKSSTEDYTIDETERTNGQRDQLAREIEDLYVVANYSKIGLKQDRILSISMLYVTLESYIPRNELAETIRSIQVHGKCSFTKEQLYWLSWKSIYSSLTDVPLSATDGLIIDDLKSYLARKDMKTFNGFNVSHVSKLAWAFKKNVRYHASPVESLSWGYRRISNGTK